MPLQPFRRLSPALGAGEVARVAQDFQGIKSNQLLNLGRQQALDENDANDGTREDARKQASIQAGAISALPYVLAGDAAGVIANLKARGDTLDEQGVDSTGTRKAQAEFESGDPARMAAAGQIIQEIAKQANLSLTSQSRNTVPSRIQVGNHYTGLGDGSTPERTPDPNTGVSKAQLEFITANRNNSTVKEFADTLVNVDNTTGLADVVTTGGGQPQTTQPQQPTQQQAPNTPAQQTSADETQAQSVATQEAVVARQQATQDGGIQDGQFVPQVLATAQPGQPLDASMKAKNAGIVKATEQRALNAANNENLSVEGAIKRTEALINDAPNSQGMAEYKSKMSRNALSAIDRAITIVQENPNLSVGGVADFFLPTVGEGGTVTDSGNVILGELLGGKHEPSFDLESELTTVFGVIAFEALNQMRANSKTGGALGQVSNFEIGLLKAQQVQINQRSGGSVESRLGLLKGRMELIRDVASIEGAAATAILNGANPDEIQASMFSEIKRVYTKHGRDGGEFKNGIYQGVSDTGVTADANEKPSELTPRQQEIADLKAQLGEG